MGGVVEIGYQGWIQTSPLSGNFTSPFDINFNLTRSVQKLSFQDASDYTANLISKKYDKLHLCFSGGLDSEFVAKVLIRNNILFTPIILLTQYNELESWYAYKFCNDNKLTPIILDVRSNDKNFSLLKSLLSKSAKLQVAPHPSLISNVIAEMLPNVCLITGSGESINDSVKFDNVVGDTAILYGWSFYLELEYVDQHPGAFFSYTPEIFYSHNNEINKNKNSQIAKSELYVILPRPKFWYNPLNFNIPEINSLNKNLSKKFHRPNNISCWTMPRAKLLKKLIDY